MKPPSARYQRLLLCLALAFVLGSAPDVLPHAMPTAAQASSTSRTFPETGKIVTGRFLEYWQQNGGLARHGLPISDELQERSDTDGNTYTVQYFERSVFESHPRNQPPHDVLLQLQGVFRYRQRWSPPSPEEKANTGPGAQKFLQTGKTVGGQFLEYWRKNGGLAQFGYPISEEFSEVSPLDNKEYRVQYFERAVFELHPQNQPPHDVLLAQLGTFRWRTRPENLASVTPHIRSDIPDGKYIPLYPGGVLTLSDDDEKVHPIRSVFLEVPADAVRVASFFDYYLPKFGWVFLYEDGYYDGTYFWTDPEGTMPWHLNLNLSVVGNLGSGRSTVRLFYNRYPKPDRTPFYPDAQSKEVKAGQRHRHPLIPATCPESATHTTFLTAATAEEVESYYRSLLAKYGWRLEPNAKTIQSPEPLLFIAARVVGLRGDGRRFLQIVEQQHLAITAHLDQDGLLRVTHVQGSCEFEYGGPYGP